MPPRVFFFLRKSFCSILPLHTRKCLSSHTAHLSLLDRGLSRSEPYTAQFFTLPTCAHSLCEFTTLHPYFPLCDLKQPGLSQCCSSLVWQGREPLTGLSPRSPGAGLGARGWGGSRPGPALVPGTLCPEAIPLPSVFSVSSILFGLLSSYTLGYCWLFALFLSRSARCFTCVQGEVVSVPSLNWKCL